MAIVKRAIKLYRSIFNGDTLYRSSLFWCWLLTPILTGVGLIWYAVPADWAVAITVDGFKLWAESFKVPITIMALSGPLVAIYVAQHRSEHQDKLYKAQGEQNRRSDYQKSREDFAVNYDDFKDSIGDSRIKSNYPLARNLLKRIWVRDFDYDLQKLSTIALRLNDKVVALNSSIFNLDANLKEVGGRADDLDDELLRVCKMRVHDYLMVLTHEVNGLGIKVPARPDAKVFSFLENTYKFQSWLSSEVSYLSGLPFPPVVLNNDKLHTYREGLRLNLEYTEYIAFVKILKNTVNKESLS